LVSDTTFGRFWLGVSPALADIPKPIVCGQMCFASDEPLGRYS